MGAKRKNKNKKKQIDLNYEINENIEELEADDNNFQFEKIEQKENPLNFDIKDLTATKNSISSFNSCDNIPVHREYKLLTS